jgi:eukaryotic-like serine/threonine-protein kinase
MEISDQARQTGTVPPDLLPLIRRSGVLSDRLFEDISSKVRDGEYPAETRALADRLVAERILTEFQAGRILRNKTHGLVIGRYVILDRVGAGGRGRVFKAQHRLMGRLAALKVIAPQIASRATSIARFYREMRLIGRLDHPNVVRAFDGDQIGDLLYIVMEYVAGRSLDHVIADRGSLPAAEVVDYMAQAVAGLAHAHERGIIHRDVKPGNLLLSDDGQVKVLDLGLSALMEADSAASFATAAGLIVGTVNYMSPEQAMAMEVDGRSDIFSLGCTMYQLLSGRLPFPGESLAECLALRIKGRTTPIREFRPDVSPRLADALEKLLARRPDDRFQTAAAAAAALRECAGQESASSAGRSPSQSARDPSAHAAAASGDTSAAGPSPREPRAAFNPAPSSWTHYISVLAAQPPLVTLVIFLVVLAVFGVGFALGNVWASLPR